jgi:hypothetical protein
VDFSFPHDELMGIWSETCLCKSEINLLIVPTGANTYYLTPRLPER